MNVNDIFPSRFVKAHDLGDKEVTVTVKSATMEDMGHGAEKETKLCIWFERATKGFVLNKTNAMIIASMYGPETDNWKGKAITIYSARVKAFGAWHDAVRVKEQVPARNVGAARIPDAMQETPPLDDEEDLLDVDEGNSDIAQPGPSVTSEGDVLFESGTPGVKHKSPPHNRLWGIGMAVLGPNDWDMARPWVIKQWTKNNSPDSIRTSAGNLSDDEKSMLGDYLNQNASTVQKLWPLQKAKMLKAEQEAAQNEPEKATA